MRVAFKIILSVAVLLSFAFTVCFFLKIYDVLFAVLFLCGWFIVGLIVLIGCLVHEFDCPE